MTRPSYHASPPEPTPQMSSSSAASMSSALQTPAGVFASVQALPFQWASMGTSGPLPVPQTEDLDRTSRSSKEYQLPGSGVFVCVQSTGPAAWAGAAPIAVTAAAAP